MKVLNDILGYKDLMIYQNPDFFCFSLDSVILANFATIRLRDDKICDLGTGNGVIPLIFTKRTDKDIFCVEIQKKLYDLAVESFKYNKVEDRISVFNCDISDDSKFSYVDFFDLVVCNPPYFSVEEKSLINISKEKQIARHELKMDLDKLFSTSFRILKTGGNLCIVHRPDRLMEILNKMQKYNLEPKRIKFIYQNIETPSKLVLIEAQKYGKLGMKVDAPLIMYNIDGTMTNEYLNITQEVRR